MNLGSGIGSAIVNNGKLLRGSNNIIGEIGHIVIDPNGYPCDCGRKGCLQALHCINGLERRAGMPFAEMVTLAQRKDAGCRALLEQTADVLAMWIANMANLYNAPLAVVYGQMLDEWGEMFPLLEEKIGRYIWTPVKGNFAIKESQIPRDKLPVIAAASVVLTDALISNIDIAQTQ